MTRSSEHEWLKKQIKYAHIRKKFWQSLLPLFFLVVSYLVKMDLCIRLLYFTDICQAKNVYFVRRHLRKVFSQHLQSAADCQHNQFLCDVCFLKCTTSYPTWQTTTLKTCNRRIALWFLKGFFLCAIFPFLRLIRI